MIDHALHNCPATNLPYRKTVIQANHPLTLSMLILDQNQPKENKQFHTFQKYPRRVDQIKGRYGGILGSWYNRTVNEPPDYFN